MAKIKVNYENTSAMITSLTKMRNDAEDYYQALKKADTGLDWKVSAAENIKTDLIKYEKKLRSNIKLMDEYIEALREISDGFSGMEKSLSNKSKDLSYMMKKITAMLTALTKPLATSAALTLTWLRTLCKIKNLFGIGKTSKNGKTSVMEKTAEQVAAEKQAAEEKAKAEQEAKAAAEAAEVARLEREQKEARLNQLKNDSTLNQQLSQRQINRIEKSGNGYVRRVGNCNVSSATMLLNRRLYLDQGESGTKFTPLNVYDANGCQVLNGPTQNYTGNSWGYDGYEFTGDSGGWGNKSYTNASGTSYKMESISKSSVDNILKNNGLSYDQYIAQLLEKHPEGICLRNNKANHVFVITDVQTLSDGKIQYYVQDPVNGYTGTLEGSYLYKNSVGKGNTDIFQSLDFISYLQ